MKITRQEIEHVAALARLMPDDAALDNYLTQINRILDYIAMLEELDTTGVPPATHAISLTNAFRDDTVHAHLSLDQALANAPQNSAAEFLVPKIIG